MSIIETKSMAKNKGDGREIEDMVNKLHLSISVKKVHERGYVAQLMDLA